MKWKIVTDSGSNIFEIDDLPEDTSFERVPMLLYLDGEEVIDTPDLDTVELIEKIYSSDKAGSACPSPGVYAEKFEGADNVIAFTITGTLSGSYGSALAGRDLVLEENPDVNIHVLDSKATAGEMDLLIRKAVELIRAEKTFDEVVETLKEYHKTTRLAYMFKSIENFVKNGRVNEFIGSVVGMLNIHVIGIRSDEGTIEMTSRARGEKRAIKAFIKDLINSGFNGRVLEIAHVHNRPLADEIAGILREKYPNVEVTIRNTSGLCTLYTERGGITVGFERDI